MLRTAGSCTTSERQYPKRERYVKIEISLKVCDSAGDGSSKTAIISALFPSDTRIYVVTLSWKPVSLNWPSQLDRLVCIA